MAYHQTHHVYVYIAYGRYVLLDVLRYVLIYILLDVLLYVVYSSRIPTSIPSVRCHVYPYGVTSTPMEPCWCTGLHLHGLL